MAAEGTAVETDDVMVTTGGQQVIDLVCRAFLDPGDVVVAEAPTYPGAVPCFNSFQADVVQVEMDDYGMRIDVLEQTLGPPARGGPPAEVHLHDPELPEPGRRDDGRGPAARAGPGSRAEQELVILEDNPYGLLRYEGDPLPTLYSLDGGRYVIYLGTFSKILSAGPAARLGGGARPDPRAPEPRQAGRRPVLVAADPVLRRRLLPAPRLAHLPDAAARDLPPPARRDARGAGGVPARRGDVDDARRAACSSGRSCPTTSTRPTCWPVRCASTSRSCPAAPRTSTAAAARRCA